MPGVIDPPPHPLSAQRNGLLRINPDVKVVIATGYYPEDSVKAHLEGEGRGFISQPYDMSEMLRAVRKVLDK